MYDLIWMPESHIKQQKYKKYTYNTESDISFLLFKKLATLGFTVSQIYQFCRADLFWICPGYTIPNCLKGTGCVSRSTLAWDPIIFYMCVYNALMYMFVYAYFILHGTDLPHFLLSWLNSITNPLCSQNTTFFFALC